MVFPSFARQVIELLSSTETTERGNTEWSWPDTGQTLTGCVVDPVQSFEDNQNRTAEITSYRVQAPPKYTIGDNDRIRYRGKVYQIVGEVQFQPSPTGALDQLVFVMERWSG